MYMNAMDKLFHGDYIRMLSWDVQETKWTVLRMREGALSPSYAVPNYSYTSESKFGNTDYDTIWVDTTGNVVLHDRTKPVQLTPKWDSKSTLV